MGRPSVQVLIVLHHSTSSPEALASIDCRICTIHEIGQHDRRLFIVPEYMSGQTLKHVVQGSPLELERMLGL